MSTNKPPMPKPKTQPSGKYGNQQTVAIDGTVFASKKECRRYEELLILFHLGKIGSLRTQVRYELIPKQDGERKVEYVADFVYIDLEKLCERVEDTKGFRTRDYIIKRKLMLWLKGIRIEEI
jgi:Protein of unknown function (DUF1064)